MGQRFERDRIEAQDIIDALERIDMSDGSFERVFGIAQKQWDNILAGKAPVPNWIPINLAMLENCPTALAEAKRRAGELISFDNHNPERGEYPYLKGDKNV